MADLVNNAVNSQRFPVNTFVKIDGKGKGKVIRELQSTNGIKYAVLIDGVDFEAHLAPERLSPFEQTEDRRRRFVQFDIDDVDNFVNQQRNKNTLSKTLYDMKVLRQFMNTDEINETRDIQDIPPNELCPLLCKFFLGVRKAGGGEYEPSSLRGFLSSFDRYLRRRKYTSSLHSSADFAQVQV